MFFIPAGRVHAIGKGAFVAEIQQTSDTTYRLYDYHRKDANGRERELHTAQAFDAINFRDTDGKAVDYKAEENGAVNVADSPFFTTNVIKADAAIVRDYGSLDSFVILIATSGEADIRCGGESITLRAGHSVLLPASAGSYEIEPTGGFTALETYIR